MFEIVRAKSYKAHRPKTGLTITFVINVTIFRGKPPPKPNDYKHVEVLWEDPRRYSSDTVSCRRSHSAHGDRLDGTELLVNSNDYKPVYETSPHVLQDISIDHR
uniref:Uncharacterized protein n=1 Tax=Anopheles coluzzii TaxID=1518534 RepID=A0A8W7PN41_ANOCL